MEKKYRILVYLVLCIYSVHINPNFCFSQLSDSTFSSIFNQVLNIDIQNLQFNYSDMELYEDFDFALFRPEINAEKDGINYQVFYKGLEMVKLSRIDTSSPLIIYEFYFINFEQYKIYFVSTFNKNYPEYLLSNINGFFLYDKRLKMNYFIGTKFYGRIFNGDDKTNTFRQSSLILGRGNFHTEVVQTIISLDESLKPIKRLNFYKNKIISFSKFDFEDNIFSEHLYFFFDQEIDLSKITFDDLACLLQFPDPKLRSIGKIPINELGINLKIILNQASINSIWADPFFGYFGSAFHMK
jgi:hypothetical protein